jgi:hypothetical protein
MGVSWTLALVLMMGLAVGWRHYFKVVSQRQVLMATAARAEAARMPSSTRTPATAVVAAPGTIIPETSAMLLGGAAPPKYDPGARLVPARSVVEVLPMVNASSVFSEAAAIIQKYNSTPNWQDRLKYVFEPERVRRLMEDFYEHQRGVDPVMGALMDQGRYRIDGTEIVLQTYRGARMDGKLEIALRRTAAERLVIDWESFVGYGEMSFKDLISSRSTKPVMVRALVKVDDYYNFEFSDSKNLLSIKLTSPDGDSFVNAYCERDSVMGKWVSEDLGTRPGDSLVKGYTLWVSFPENAQSDRCLNLIQISAGRWLILPHGK